MAHSTGEIIEFEDYTSVHPDAGEILKQVRSIQALPWTERLGSGKKISEISGYLGRGVDKHAFRIGEHVLKISCLDALRSFDSQLRPMEKVRGVPGVEQLVAASSRQCAMVTEYVDGSSIISMKVDRLAECISETSLDLFDETLGEMLKRKVSVDTSSHNVFVTEPSDAAPRFVVIDPLEGFTGETNLFRIITEVAQRHAFEGNSDIITRRPPEESKHIWDAFSRARDRRLRDR